MSKIMMMLMVSLPAWQNSATRPAYLYVELPRGATIFINGDKRANDGSIYLRDLSPTEPTNFDVVIKLADGRSVQQRYALRPGQSAVFETKRLLTPEQLKIYEQIMEIKNRAFKLQLGDSPKKAAQIYEQAADLYQELFGVQSNSTYHMKRLAGTYYRKAGDYEAEASIYREYLQQLDPIESDNSRVSRSLLKEYISNAERDAKRLHNASIQIDAPPNARVTVDGKPYPVLGRFEVHGMKSGSQRQVALEIRMPDGRELKKTITLTPTQKFRLTREQLFSSEQRWTQQVLGSLSSEIYRLGNEKKYDQAYARWTDSCVLTGRLWGVNDAITRRQYLNAAQFALNAGDPTKTEEFCCQAYQATLGQTDYQVRLDLERVDWLMNELQRVWVPRWPVRDSSIKSGAILEFETPRGSKVFLDGQLKEDIKEIPFRDLPQKKFSPYWLHIELPDGRSFPQHARPIGIEPGYRFRITRFDLLTDEDQKKRALAENFQKSAQNLRKAGDYVGALAALRHATTIYDEIVGPSYEATLRHEFDIALLFKRLNMTEVSDHIFNDLNRRAMKLPKNSKEWLDRIASTRHLKNVFEQGIKNVPKIELPSNDRHPTSLTRQRVNYDSNPELYFTLSLDAPAGTQVSIDGKEMPLQAKYHIGPIPKGFNQRHLVDIRLPDGTRRGGTWTLHSAGQYTMTREMLMPSKK